MYKYVYVYVRMYVPMYVRMYVSIMYVHMYDYHLHLHPTDQYQQDIHLRNVEDVVDSKPHFKLYNAIGFLILYHMLYKLK